MQSIRDLAAVYEGFKLYNAGFPNTAALAGYPRNFARDGIISAMLLQNMKMLKGQLEFCSFKQGKRKNPVTGEEPGKIFHEYPSVSLRGLETGFAACDTTALYLVGHYVFKTTTNSNELVYKYELNIEKAMAYILSHLRGGLFFEDPKLCGAKKFALHVTYWKDSALPGRENGLPRYPISYVLAHIQNMAGLRAADFLLGEKGLYKEAAHMREAIMAKFYDKKNKGLLLARDKEGVISAVSSDWLHMLFYLEPGDIPAGKLAGIIDGTTDLETNLGYRTLSEKSGKGMKDKYHVNTVWPFEQAIINSGARKHMKWAQKEDEKSLAQKLSHVVEVSGRMSKYLDTATEQFVIKNGKMKKAGCDPQLWSLAAQEYFKNPRIMLQIPTA